ncbi:MAG TPA: SIMPL domain-containing protein [Chlorobiota bacterium]|nr:SIMPL domain-containing protein [Chlorobiota bacterium]
MFRIITIHVLALVAACPAVSHLISDTSEPVIEVMASVDKRILADRAEFRFSVDGYGSTLAMSVDQARSATDSILRELDSLGIDRAQISTLYYRSGENRGDKAFLSSSRDFNTRVTTLVVIDSLELLTRAVTLVSSAGAQDVGHVVFSLRNETDSLRNLHKRAAQEARSKADDIAGALGARVGRIIFVDQTGNRSLREATLYGGFGANYSNAMSGTVSYTTPTPFAISVSDAHPASVMFNIPEIQLTTKVFVRFALVES